MENREETRVRKGAWSSEEDILLRDCIHKYGEGKWHLVPLRAGLNRCRKSCRLRWLNYLRPDIKRGHFGKDEVDLLVRLHKLLGNRWSLIAGRLPGRTANDVKNFWNTHISKKPPSAGETDRGKTITVTRSNIVRPRPRTFSSSQIPSWSIQLTKSKSYPLLTQHDNGNPTKTQLPSSSAAVTAEKADNQKSCDIDVNQTAALHEDLDECNGGVEWWGNLLHMAENGLETPFWFSDDGPQITHELTSAEGIRDHGVQHDGLCGSSSLYGDDLNLNNIYDL